MDSIFNVLILLAEIPGFYIVLKKDGLKTFVYYTEIANLLALIASLIYLIDPLKASMLRYTATCMLTLTFLVVVFVLGPADGYRRQLLDENSLYQHVLVPFLSFVSYVFMEGHRSLWIVPVLLSMAYGSFMFYMNDRKKIDGPYPFFKVKEQGYKASILWFIALFVLILSVSLLVKFLAGE